MLGKIESGRRRGQQRMRWLDGITDLMDMSLGPAAPRQRPRESFFNASRGPSPLPCNNPQSLLKLLCIESVMPSNHLILCHPLLLPLSIFPSIRVFSSELILRHVAGGRLWP